MVYVFGVYSKKYKSCILHLHIHFVMQKMLWLKFFFLNILFETNVYSSLSYIKSPLRYLLLTETKSENDSANEGKMKAL